MQVSFPALAATTTTTTSASTSAPNTAIPLFQSAPGTGSRELSLVGGVPVASKHDALAAAHALGGEQAITQAPSGGWLVGPLQSTGQTDAKFQAASPAHLWDWLHELQAAPDAAAVTWGGSTYLPFGSGQGSTAATAAGHLLLSTPGDSTVTIGAGLAAANAMAAVKAASHLSAGDAGAYAVLREGDGSYAVHPLTVSGELSTRLGPKPFSHAFRLSETTNPDGWDDIASNLVVIVDGSVVAAGHAPLG